MKWKELTKTFIMFMMIVKKDPFLSMVCIKILLLLNQSELNQSDICPGDLGEWFLEKGVVGKFRILHS